MNCLEWNEKGTILASGSDDHDVILWNPFIRKKLRTLNTGHEGNIFSVKFLPRSNDSLIATCAGDNSVKLFDISVNEILLDCNCHANRVKRLATASDSPSTFWSAAEDGLVIQFDMRQPHRCKDTKNIFINLSNQQARAEAKCININPIRQELMAVGANDPYIRLYDRRHIENASKLSSSHVICYSNSSNNSDDSDCDSPANTRMSGTAQNCFLNHPTSLKNCLAYLAPGHLQTSSNKQGLFSTTYVTFSPDGTELLSNIGSEQIYLFNLFQSRKKFKFFKFKECLETHAVTSKQSGISELECARPLTDYQETLKESAILALKEKRYCSTIDTCNKLLASVDNDSDIYRIRAKALLERKWEGDKYLAMRDAAAAVFLKSDCFKSHSYLIDSLVLLGRLDEASECLEYATSKFSGNKSTFLTLRKKIEEAKTRAESKRSLTTIRERRPGSLMTLDRFSFLNGQSNNDSDSDTSSAGRNSSSGFCSLDDYNENTSDESMNEACQNSSPLTQEVCEKEDLKKRLSASDFDARFCGHCNTTTDIKEANFFGGNGQFVVAGSDEGSFFIWDKKTTNIIKALRGDDSIVNCLQPHPDICMLATSGIDPIVKIWSPLGCATNRDIEDVESVASWNQKRMQIDPLEAMLMMIYRPGLS